MDLTFKVVTWTRMSGDSIANKAKVIKHKVKVRITVEVKVKVKRKKTTLKKTT